MRRPAAALARPAQQKGQPGEGNCVCPASLSFHSPPLVLDPFFMPYISPAGPHLSAQLPSGRSPILLPLGLQWTQGLRLGAPERRKEACFGRGT